MSTTYLVLDLETIPDPDVHSPPDPSPGVERPFPPIYAHKPIVIGVMWLDDTFTCKRIGIVGEDKDEAGMIADFADFMAKWKPTVVTWNGRAFDLPVLTLRALRHGVPVPWYYRERDYRYRYSDEGHLDLMDFLANHGAVRQLPLAGPARLIGLPGKEGIDGSQVEGLYHAGQIEALRQYCLSDVAQTAFLFLRTRLLVGVLDRDGYRRAAENLLAALATDDRCARLVTLVDRARLLLEDG